jgi:integrase
MGDGFDIYDAPTRIERAESALDDANEQGEITDADYEAICEYLRNRETDSLSKHTYEGLYDKLRVAATESEIPLTDATTSEDVTAILYAVKHRRGKENPLAPKTMQLYKSYLGGFLEYREQDDLADEIDQKRPQNAERNINPADMLTQDDLKAMRAAAANPRDRTLMTVMMDTGARISMLATLRRKDLHLDRELPVFTPNPNAEGLKDAPQHAYPLIDSVADLRTYINHHHPRPDDSDAPVFHKLSGYYRPEDDDDGALAHSTIWKNLKRIAARAGVEKPVNPHNWRHSSITRMSREGFTETEIQTRAGWNDPSMLDRYEHVTAEQVNTQIGVRAGILDEEDGQSPERDPCKHCRAIVPPSAEYCPQCGVPATQDARRSRKQAKADALDDLTAASDPQKQQIARIVFEMLDDPDKLAEVRNLNTTD